ncbi:MAG: hypothetical protein QMC37_11865, partial [Flavobacteriales bacterium]
TAFEWDQSQRDKINMLTTLTNEIGYLHEQLRDVHEELKRKSTEVGVMSTTITQPKLFIVDSSKII